MAVILSLAQWLEVLVIIIVILSLQISDFEIEARYSRMLRELLEDHKEVVTMLAEGFSECRKHIKVGVGKIWITLIRPTVRIFQL